MISRALTWWTRCMTTNDAFWLGFAAGVPAASVAIVAIMLICLWFFECEEEQ